MTQSTFAISLQSVNHVDRGNGVAAALKRDFGRDRGLRRRTASANGISLMQGGMARWGSALLGALVGLLSILGQLLLEPVILGQTIFESIGLPGYQLGKAIAPRQNSGRCKHEIIVPTQH